MASVLTWFGHGLDQDWVDSANGFWSVLLLSVCSVGAFLVRYVIQPISCWTPPHMTVIQGLYMQQSCFLNEDKLFLKNSRFDNNMSGNVSYHLWIPLILCLQAVCFKIPAVIWNIGKTSLIINIDKTVSSLESAELKGGEVRTTTLRNSAVILHSLLRRHNILLGIYYLAVKLLYCLNLLGQFIFLTIFFRHLLPVKPKTNFGLDIFSRFTYFLPTEVMCEARIVKTHYVQTYTVQCQLLISEIYEKMFVFLWYWVFLLTVVSVFNLLLWAGFLFLPFLRDSRISAYIKASPGSPHDFPAITRFISGFLGIDGVLMLSMISRNSSEMLAADLSQHLYQVFLEQNLQPWTQTGTTVTQPGVLAEDPDVDSVAVTEDTAQPLGASGYSENINMNVYPDTRMEKPLIVATENE